METALVMDRLEAMTTPVGGSRCREPVGGFAEAWDSAGDHQPAGVRARSTFEDTPTQSIEPASHADGLGRSVYPGLSADPRPARRGRAHRLRGISGATGRTYGDGVNGSRPPSCRAGRGGVSRRLSGGAGAPPPDGSRDQSPGRAHRSRDPDRRVAG